MTEHLPPPAPSTTPAGAGVPAGVPAGYQPYEAPPAFVYASWGARLGAYILRTLPGVVLCLPVQIAMFASVASSSTSFNADGSPNVHVNGPGVGLLIVMAVAYALIVLIQCRSMIQRGRLGYDFADAAVGQGLVSDGTAQPLGSGWQVFGRSLLHIVDAIPCYLGFLAPLWTAKKQTFADSIMKTVVVQSPPAYRAKQLFVNTLTFWKPVIKN